jgi:iron complex outermembrane receptor protein
LWDRVHLSLGTRYDQQIAHGVDPWNPIKTPYLSQFERAETSQAGLVFDVTKVVSVYGDWSQSYTPNAVTSVDSTGHAGFPPEKGTQYEVGTKVETPDHRLFASFAGYWIERTNVLVSTGLTLPVTAQPVFRLDGAQHSEGVEFESEWRPINNWQVQGGFALGKAFVAESSKNPQSIGLDLASAPRVSGSFWNRYNVPKGPLTGLGFGLGVNYVGKQWAGDPTSSVYFLLDSWVRVDTAVYYRWHRYSLTLSVQNLLDNRYILAGQGATFLIPGDARKFTLTIKTTF